jgi:capsular exopolysaccharide synthesis family protein
VPAEKDLPEVLDALRRRWLLLVLVALPLFAGVAFYAERLPSTYDGGAVVSFAPRLTQSGTQISGDTLRLYLPRFISYVTSRATVNKVADRLGLDRGKLKRGTDARIATDTTNLTIKVRLRDPDDASAAANALADEVRAFTTGDQLVAGEVVVRGLPPGSPSGPPRRLFELAGLVAAGLIGAIVAFIVERGRPRVRSATEVAELTGFPVVGRVPIARALRSSPAEALDDPAVGAAIRTLRTQVERDSRDRPIRVLMLTSPQSGDGKTTVAAAYAAAVARLDARVLLVDGDLRRPQVASAFDLDVVHGTSDLLRGKAGLEDCVQQSSVAGLTVLPTNADPAAGDLLARGFTALIAEARNDYDVVIVDAPPLLGGDDARTLATLSEAVLFVVASGVQRDVLLEASVALDSLRVRVLGCVLNRYRDRRGTYGAYGSYGNEATR